MLSNLMCLGHQVRELFLEEMQIIVHLMILISKCHNTNLGKECIFFFFNLMTYIDDKSCYIFMVTGINKLSNQEPQTDTDFPIVHILYSSIFEVLNDLKNQIDQQNCLSIIENLLLIGKGYADSGNQNGHNIFSKYLQMNCDWIESLQGLNPKQNQTIFESTKRQQITDKYFLELTE